MKWNRSWPGRAEQVEPEVARQGDAAEVHGDRGRGLAVGHAAGVVDAHECSVIAASVDSGSMSEMDPMKVVLPTAKPPATTILTVMGAVGGSAWPPAPAAPAAAATSERGNAIENTLQDLEVGGAAGSRSRRTGVDDDQTFVGEVADEDANDAEGQGQVRRQLGDRQDRVRAQLEDAPALRRSATGSVRAVDATDERLERQVGAAGPGAATGQRVRPDDARLLDGSPS